jgi:hypothetical protein
MALSPPPLNDNSGSSDIFVLKLSLTLCPANPIKIDGKAPYYASIPLAYSAAASFGITY